MCYNLRDNLNPRQVRKPLLELDLIDLFTQSPGDFFYHVVVVLALSAGLAIALGQLNRRPQSRTASRYSLATGGALLGWFILMAGALFAVFTRQDATMILPPLERAVTSTAMLLIGWAFLTADAERHGGVVSSGLFVLLLTIVIGYVMTGVQWAGLASSLDFNLSRLGVAWAFIQMVIALLGTVLMLGYFRSIIDAPLKILFFLLLLLGFGASLWQLSSGVVFGSYSGLARLGMFLAAPIVPLVIYRKIVYGYELALELQLEQSGPIPTVPTPNRTGYVPASAGSSHRNVTQVIKGEGNDEPAATPYVERESALLLRTMGIILEQVKPADIPRRIVEAAANVLKADIGVLLLVDDANYADIELAYDRVMDRPIPAMLSLNLEKQVTLVNAIERKQQRPLFVDRNPDELEDLYNRLDIAQVGPTYLQPLMRDDELVAILVIGLPYARRELLDSERELLKGIGIMSGSLLALSRAANEATMRAEERTIQAMLAGVPLDEVEDDDVLSAHKEMQSALDAARLQNQELQKQVALLKLELDDERTRLTGLLGDTQQGLSLTERIVAIRNDQENLRAEREALTERLQAAETAFTSATGTEDDAMLNAQLEQLTQEKQELNKELEHLRNQLAEIRENGGDLLPAAAQDVLNSMIQERERLQAERDRMSARLKDMEAQLAALGMDGSESGLTQMVQQLYDQRSALQARMEVLKVERDALLIERRRFEKRMRKEDEREGQIERMEAEIRHIAGDREAITRQLESIRRERDDTAERLDKMKEQRARLLAKSTEYEEEIVELNARLERMQERFSAASTDRGKIASERDRLLAERRALESERDQLLAQIGGDSSQLQQLREDARNELAEMIENITSQRDRLERELNTALAQLEDAQAQPPPAPPPPEPTPAVNGAQNDDTGKLYMSMVQELRTPITPILGFIELLVNESGGYLSEMQRDFVQRISANVVRLQTMLNDIAHLTALSTGQYRLKLESVDVIELLEEMITTATHQFRQRSLRLDLQLDEDIPPIFADPSALQQIMGQLLTNAYLVSPPESKVGITAEQTRLHLKDDQPTDAILFGVSDYGGGVADDDLEMVFSPRYHADHQIIRGIGDTNVGLPIARALVEAHKGVMWIESQDGVGSVFYFAIPMTLQPEPFHATES